MPCHLVSNKHEWINEIPTVPICYLVKPYPRGKAWQKQLGIEDPVSLENFTSNLMGGGGGI